MEALSLYLALVVLVSTVVAATLALVAFGVFRHRTALWLSLAMVGLVFFALTAVFAVLRTTPGLAVPGLSLVWQALGAVLLTHCLPRMALAAFGVNTHGWPRRALDALTVLVAALSVLRVVSGWEGGDRTPVWALPNVALEVLLFGVIGAVVVLTLAYQSRLPDRSLYRTLATQAGVLVVLVPLVLVEDLGLVRVPGLPLLAGEATIALCAATAAWHTATTLLRPKYVTGQAPSPYFVEHFGITPRELDVVKAVLAGQSNKEMAERLFISPRTVERHLSNLYQKLGIQSRLQLVNLLRSEGL